MHYRDHLWVLPFISLLLGYSTIAFLYPIKKVPAPSIVGMRLEESVKVLSTLNLNIRIIGTKQDAELPNGTLLQQTPSAGTPMKEYQTLYCVLSYQPKPPLMPDLTSSTDTQIVPMLQALGIRHKIHYLSHCATKGSCISQSPAADQPIASSEVAHIYCSAGSNIPLIMPNLKTGVVPDVVQALEEQGFLYKFTNPIVTHEHECTGCTIADHWPKAGSFILANNHTMPTVQLRIQHNRLHEH